MHAEVTVALCAVIWQKPVPSWWCCIISLACAVERAICVVTFGERPTNSTLCALINIYKTQEQTMFDQTQTASWALFRVTLCAHGDECILKYYIIRFCTLLFRPQAYPYALLKQLHENQTWQGGVWVKQRCVSVIQDSDLGPKPIFLAQYWHEWGIN